jgi:hypothetical protein
MTQYPDHIGAAKMLLEQQAIINALRTERDALAARVAELESDCDAFAVLNEADVRAVAALLNAEHWDVIGTAKASTALRARFVDRIAALEDDADGGAQ